METQLLLTMGQTVSQITQFYTRVLYGWGEIMQMQNTNESEICISYKFNEQNKSVQ